MAVVGVIAPDIFIVHFHVITGQTLGESAKTVGSIVGGSIGGFGVGLLIGVIVFKAFLRFRRVSGSYYVLVIICATHILQVLVKH